MRGVPVAGSAEFEIKLSKKIKILTLAALGNCLELYDYTLYAVMLPFLAPLFFPAESSGISLIFGYLSFGIAFFFAPVGAIFWGWFGDRFGRLKMLRTAMMFMAVSSLSIALLPSYESIGFLAPILLILLRVIQGISASGEVKGAKIFAMEHLGERYHGLASGVISAGGAMGVMIAMFMAYLASSTEMEGFWRIPFAIGSALYVLAIIMRKVLTESKEYKAYQKKAESITYLQNIIRENKSSSSVVFFLGGLIGVLSYMMHAFIPPYVTTLGYEKGQVYMFSIIAYVATMISSVIIGHYTSRFVLSSLRVVMTITALTTPPLFALLNMGSMHVVIFSYILLGLNLGAFASICSVVMFRVFPAHIRCRGVLFNYALGVGIFGGMTPLLLNLASKLHLILPGLLVAIFTIFVKRIFEKEVKNVSLS